MTGDLTPGSKPKKFKLKKHVKRVRKLIDAAFEALDQVNDAFTEFEMAAQTEATVCVDIEAAHSGYDRLITAMKAHRYEPLPYQQPLFKTLEQMQIERIQASKSAHAEYRSWLIALALERKVFPYVRQDTFHPWIKSDHP